MTPFHNHLNPDPRHANTAPHRKRAEIEQVESDRAERGVGDGRAAKGQVQVGELLAAQGDDFGGGVGEGAAKGLDGGSNVS